MSAEPPVLRLERAQVREDDGAVSGDVFLGDSWSGHIVLAGPAWTALEAALEDQRHRPRLDALAPLLERLRQIRQTWPSLVDMEPGDAWREIQEIMALVPQDEL